MKKLSTLMVVFFCFGTVAEEKEVWACQQEDAQGFIRENNRWRATAFNSENVLISIEGTSVGVAAGEAKIGQLATLYFSCSSQKQFIAPFDDY